MNEGYFDLHLPQEVLFCKRCVVSNQRPSTTVEFKNQNQKTTIAFDDDQICSACRYHDMKQKTINWEEREAQLIQLLDKHRSKDGSYDVIVPGSGGKDSVYVAHVLKYKYNMHPLTVTWPPHLYTDIGRQNFESWLNQGFANITYFPNQKFHRELTREAFCRLLHPFQPFILGQKQIGPKLAAQYNIPLVMYGESQAEGGSDLEEAMRPIMHPKYYTANPDDLYRLTIGGITVDGWLSQGATMADLEPYLPMSLERVQEKNIEVHHMGFYEHWKPQEKYYYAVENCDFKPNPERSEGTYSKYASLDDKIDGFHYYTTYVKFGVGRATYDAAQEIRNGHLTREEGIALVNRYDGEFPKKYYQDFLNYTNLTDTQFHQTIDNYRQPHLWDKTPTGWVLKHGVE